MKLDTTLDKLHDCHMRSLTILLAVSIGFIVMITWVASELVHENQALTLKLNATQTALHIAKSPYFIQHSPHCSDSMLF